jgi:hypothetical protein
MEDDRVRGRTGTWVAAATLAVYWGLAGAGFLLRALNDPAMNVAAELLESQVLPLAWSLSWA